MSRLTDFKSQFLQGGARANQFRVQIHFPAIVPNGQLAGQKLQFMAHSSSLPGMTVGTAPVNYRGREIKFAGEQSFQPWSFTAYNDNDFVTYNALTAWMDSIQKLDSTNGTQSPIVYQVDMQVQHLDRNDNVIKEYDFRDAWPSAIGDISLSWGTNNVVESFDVTMEYNYFTSPTGTGVTI